MTSSALDIYKLHLTEQLGENGVFTETAIFDPSGADVTLSGVFDENNFRGNKNTTGVQQKKDGARFVVSEIITFDLYENVQLYLSYRDKMYTIQEVERDEQGAQVLWLV
mgnify:FL=1